MTRLKRYGVFWAGVVGIVILSSTLGVSSADALADRDLPGTVVHSWLANSFANEAGHQFVPVNICGIGVTPDGTVYSAGVSEAFGGVASYKDGQFVTKYDYDSGWGSSSSAVVADAEYVYIGTGAGLFRTRVGDTDYNRTAILRGNFHGLAIREDELYVSDYDSSRVRVLSTVTMEEKRSFAATTPGPLAVGADGKVWVIEGKQSKDPSESFYTGGAKIVSYSATGEIGDEISDFENPCSLALDGKGRLLVGGLNKHGQIWIYDVSGKPKKVETFGSEGGIFSGEPGQYGEKKFHWIRGLGTDKDGNLYVGSVFGTWYNVSIEAYSPFGKRLWDVHGLGNWLDTACTDPADENTVYTKENVFKMDWTKSAGQEQALAGFTVDRFKYPFDNRVRDAHGPSHRLVNGIRRIEGKPFLYCGYQGTSSLEIYKFDNGVVAIPCGIVGGASNWRPNNGKRWPEDAESFIWIDNNQNGVPDPDEFADAKKEPRWGSMHLDAKAGIWQCAGESIWHLPCGGLDKNGNPVYLRSSELTYKNPKEFSNSRLRRLFYLPAEDALITGGSPQTEENVCDLLICYDFWSDAAKRKQRWSIRVPLDDKEYTAETSYGGGGVQAISAVGNYLFMSYGYGCIRVHALSNGAFVGTLRPNINGYKGGGGCVDSDNALNVTLLSTGEYVMFLENAGRNHVMMFRWTPPASGG